MCLLMPMHKRPGLPGARDHSWQLRNFAHKSQGEYMYDVCDGSHFNSHAVFGFEHSSMQIIFYYDDMEVCNPLGSKRSKHKLGKGTLQIYLCAVSQCLAI